MFDKKKFSDILKAIYNSYENQRSFASATGVNRGYLSRYINMKIDNPPSPKILKNIADGSHGVTNYDELMKICGYITYEEINSINNSLVKPTLNNFYTIPILIIENGKLCETEKDMLLPFDWDHVHSYFALRINDESMSPALGIDDIAIIEKTTDFKDGQTCLLSIDNNIIIRTIKDNKNYIELHALNFHFDSMKLTKEDMIERHFSIIGKVVKAENESLFK